MFQNPKDKVRIQHILEAIYQIEDYIQNISYDNFVSNKMLVDAVVRQLEIVGEATNHLSDDKNCVIQMWNGNR